MDFHGTIGGVVADARISSVTYSAGYAYIVGQFSGQLKLSPGGVLTTFTSAGGTDFFMAKYDTAGNLLWFKQFGDASDQTGVSITADNLGNIYALGTNVAASPSIVFGSYTVSNPTSGVNYNFLVKIDASGTPQAAVLGGSFGALVSPKCLAYSSISNSLYVIDQTSGFFVYWNGTTFVSVASIIGVSDLLIIKYDLALNFKSFAQVGAVSANFSAVKAICGQYFMGSTIKATVHIAGGYSGSGIMLGGVSFAGSSGGAIITFDDDAFTTTTPVFKNVFALQNTFFSSITKNYAVANNTVTTIIPFSITVSKVALINFRNDGIYNWATYSGSSNSVISNTVTGHTIAKGTNKVFVIGQLGGNITIPFGSTTITSSLRYYPFIWQYYNCL